MMKSAHPSELLTRVEDRIAAWRIDVERVAETESSVLAFGRRGNQPVVLKVIKSLSDEWRSGAILVAFEGKGTVRVYDYIPGAMLLERLSPGESLAAMALSGRDDDATDVLVESIRAMSPRTPVNSAPTARDWGMGFERYAASGDAQVPRDLLEEAHRVYSELCDSQTRTRLLHGDLHHDNVLFDAGRGWLAVDPKGVVGELEFEVGAALRNPHEGLELFANASVVQKRAERFAKELQLDLARVLSWAFAQAVLAVIWGIEDGLRVEQRDGWITLAAALRPMVDSQRTR
jgi:streptomycin 6-kinase